MNSAATAERVGAALQRMAAPVGACSSSVAIETVGRAADRAAGLAAAAHALAAVGCATPAVVGHESDGRPRWPRDHTGSIAHAGHVAVAVVADTSVVTALGVDVELAGALPARDADAVLDVDEQAFVARASHPDHLATLLWSAKEAAFKAWSTATDGRLGDVDPADIHVTLDEHRRDGAPTAVRVDARGALAGRITKIGPLLGWCVRERDYVLVLLCAAAVDARRGQPVDGIASAAITTPSAANATT